MRLICSTFIRNKSHNKFRIPVSQALGLAQGGGRGDAHRPHRNFSSNQRIISGNIYLLSAILESGSSPLNLSLALV